MVEDPSLSIAVMLRQGILFGRSNFRIDSIGNFAAINQVGLVCDYFVGQTTY